MLPLTDIFRLFRFLEISFVGESCLVANCDFTSAGDGNELGSSGFAFASTTNLGSVAVVVGVGAGAVDVDGCPDAPNLAARCSS